MRLALTIPLAIVALAAPATADAATLAPLGACYRSADALSREHVTVSATGFTPGAAVDVAIDGRIVRSAVTALPDGSIDGDVLAPYQKRGERPFTLTVTEQGRPANFAAASSRVTALALRLKPAQAPPRKRVRFRGRGFTDGPEVFAHYVRAGKVRTTVSLGAPQGPCGQVHVRRRQIPVKNPATGKWRLQVDNQRRYSPTPATVFVRVTIVVSHVPRTSP